MNDLKEIADKDLLLREQEKTIQRIAECNKYLVKLSTQIARVDELRFSDKLEITNWEKPSSDWGSSFYVVSVIRHPQESGFRPFRVKGTYLETRSRDEAIDHAVKLAREFHIGDPYQDVRLEIKTSSGRPEVCRS
jgi:hypothetical protein